MTIINDILKQMPGLGQPQRKFLATLFVTILVLRGRVNFRNLSRYCDYAERTIARQFREPFDWPDFHQRPPRRPSQAPLMALPSPILRCMSRPRSTALRLPQGHTGGAAAPRWARGRSRGEGWPLHFLSAFHGGGTKRLFEFPIRLSSTL